MRASECAKERVSLWTAARKGLAAVGDRLRRRGGGEVAARGELWSSVASAPYA